MFIAKAPNNDLAEGAGRCLCVDPINMSLLRSNGDAGSSAARRQPAAWSSVSNNLANAYNIHA